MKYILLLITFGLGAGALSPAAAADSYRRIEIETLRDAHNIGGGDIAFISCTTASGGYAIDGVDMPGEWVELSFLQVEDVCLYTAVRSAGLEGVIRNFAVEFIPDPPVTTGGTDSLATYPGTGIG